jgi:hypothetical protein
MLEQTIGEIHIMSGCLWCDKGEHSFSAKDPDRQHFTNTHTERVPTGNSYGRTTYQDQVEVTEEIDICGPCWKSSGLFAKNKPEIPAQPTLEDLEKDDDSYRRGYDAGVESILSKSGSN